MGFLSGSHFVDKQFWWDSMTQCQDNCDGDPYVDWWPWIHWIVCYFKRSHCVQWISPKSSRNIKRVCDSSASLGNVMVSCHTFKNHRTNHNLSTIPPTLDMQIHFVIFRSSPPARPSQPTTFPLGSTASLHRLLLESRMAPLRIQASLSSLP